MKTINAAELDQAKLDPASVFAAPDDVLRALGLSIADRTAILSRWETDADALLRATGEGMPLKNSMRPSALRRLLPLALPL